MRNRILASLAALFIAAVVGVQAAAPAYAACGDSAADWVGPTGAVWSGTMDGSTSITAVMLPPVLGVQAATTVVVLQSGAGSWVHDGSFRWTSTAAGVWDYRFEVSASTCSGGMVTAASGAATDGLSVIHPVSLSRTS